MATLKQSTRKGLKKAAKVTKRTVSRLSKTVRNAIGGDEPKATKRTRRPRRRSVTTKTA